MFKMIAYTSQGLQRQAGRLIREAIWIRKTDNMNRDEGSYQLSHVWDKLLHTDDRHRKSVLTKASGVKPNVDKQYVVLVVLE